MLVAIVIRSYFLLLLLRLLLFTFSIFILKIDAVCCIEVCMDMHMTFGLVYVLYMNGLLLLFRCALRYMCISFFHSVLTVYCCSSSVIGADA